MVRLTKIVSSAIVCTAGLSSAQNVSPSLDCAKSDCEAVSAICRNDGLAELDLELSRLYGLALRGPNVDKPRAEELRCSERAWALLGLGGLMVMALIQLALAVLMLYWLTRPTEPQSNAYAAPANG